MLIMYLLALSLSVDACYLHILRLYLPCFLICVALFSNLCCFVFLCELEIREIKNNDIHMLKQVSWKFKFNYIYYIVNRDNTPIEAVVKKGDNESSTYSKIKTFLCNIYIWHFSNKR